MSSLILFHLCTVMDAINTQGLKTSSQSSTGHVPGREALLRCSLQKARREASEGCYGKNNPESSPIGPTTVEPDTQLGYPRDIFTPAQDTSLCGHHL